MNWHSMVLIGESRGDVDRVRVGRDQVEIRGHALGSRLQIMARVRHMSRACCCFFLRGISNSLTPVRDETVHAIINNQPTRKPICHPRPPPPPTA